LGFGFGEKELDVGDRELCGNTVCILRLLGWVWGFGSGVWGLGLDDHADSVL